MADAAPRPEEVDSRAIEFNDLEKALTVAMANAADAAAPLKALQIILVDWVRHFGSSHAEKSKILHGILWEMMATFGQASTQDAAAVERLRLALVKAKKARLLKKLFIKETRWKFNSGAMEVIKGEKLSAPQMSLVLQCFDTQDRTPRLDVRLKKTG